MLWESGVMSCLIRYHDHLPIILWDILILVLLKKKKFQYMFYIFSESFIFILIIISFTKLVMWLTDWPMWHMTCYLNGLLELTWLLKLIATLIPTWSFHSRLTSKRNPYSLNWTIPISYATTLTVKWWKNHP